MSIHDVDKSTFGRETPMPNAGDGQADSAFMARGTNAVNYITPASPNLTAAKNGQFTIVGSGTYTPNLLYVSPNPGAGQYANDSYLVYSAPHGLPFIPTIMAFIQSGNTYYPMPYSITSTAAGGTQAIWANTNITADATNIYVHLDVMVYGINWGVFPVTFRWYLMQQTPV